MEVVLSRIIRRATLPPLTLNESLGSYLGFSLPVLITSRQPISPTISRTELYLLGPPIRGNMNRQSTFTHHRGPYFPPVCDPALRHVLVSPKDRQVVVVESLLCPTQFRDTLASVFYRHYEVASILFVPSQLVTLCALGVRSALVVDVGYNEAQVIPVYEGVPILNAWEAQPLAGHAIEKRIRENLDKVYKDLTNAGGDTVPQVDESALVDLPESVIEDIKVRGCFVTTRKRGERLSEGVLTPEPPLLEYRLGGDRMIKVPGWVRESSCEVMFEKDNEEASLPNLILDSILKCPIDTRKALAENIVLVGGTVMAPGFKARLMEELKAHLRSPVYENRLAITAVKFHSPPAKDNCTCWLGGAIFGATDMIQMRGLTRDNYLSLQTVPDWSNLATNILSLTRLSIS